MAIINIDEFDKNSIDEENIIIGSGAGGSTIAYELMKQKKKVIILEEGPNIKKLNSPNIGQAINKLYSNNGAIPMFCSKNIGPTIGYGQGSCVGGSTFVNAGYFSSTPEHIFCDWLKKKKTNLSYDYFKSLINEIRSEIKINTEKLTAHDNDSKFIYDQSKKLNWKVEKCERFSNGKDRTKKQNMNNTYHQEIHNFGSDIIHDCKVEKIISKFNNAKYLLARSKSNHKYIFKFKNLFVNCGPIYSPHLLQKSNLLSKNFKTFEFHINFKIVVRFKNPIKKNKINKFNPDYPLSIYFLREFENEGHLLSAANSELPFLLATCNHFDKEIIKDISDNHSNYAMYIYQIKSSSYGQIKSFLGNPYINYEFNKRDFMEIKKAIERTSKFFLHSNVDYILYPVDKSSPIKNLKNVNDLMEGLKPKFLHLVSVHGMSSLRPGINDSDLSFQGNLKNFKNIYISDGSILPGNTGESPQASIMAYSKYVAKNLNF